MKRFWNDKIMYWFNIVSLNLLPMKVYISKMCDKIRDISFKICDFIYFKIILSRFFMTWFYTVMGIIFFISVYLILN